MSKYIFSLLVLLLTVNVAIGQQYQLSTKSKKAKKNYNNAVEYYKTNQINEAVDLLNRSVSADKNFIEAWMLLGDVYTDIGNLELAISSYENAVNIDSLFFLPIYYFLGNLYQEKKEFAIAQKYYSFLLNRDDVSYELSSLNKTALERNFFLSEIYSNPLPIIIENIGKDINTPGDEYVNYLNSERDYIMFTRRTINENPSYKRKYNENLFHALKNDAIWQNPELVNAEWMKGLNTGSLNLSADGRKMYLAGCYWPHTQGGCDLYVSEKTGESWLVPVDLKGLNTSGWESQPSVTSDGKKLYFSSKRPGGKGGSDIWMSVKLDNGKWSPPVNLGDSINTKGDEMAPSIHADGRTLYFSSNGHNGVGGMDLFISRMDETCIWSKARNLGIPINTEFNEIIIFTSLDGKTSWISSDREGGYGNYDIYKFDNIKEIIPQKIAYISGQIVDKDTGKPLKAKIEVTNLKNLVVVNSTQSDSINGSFLIVLFPGIDYAFNISKSGYLFLSENINLVDTVVDEYTVNRVFHLESIGKDRLLILNNINFEFNSAELVKSSEKELEEVVLLLKENPEYNIRITGHTDSIGSDAYNKNLSLERAKSVYLYLITNGIEKDRLTYEGKGSEMPLMPNNTEKGRAANRRTEIIFL